MSMRIGLISDTHDLLRPGVLDWLRGCDHLLHAGDICSSAVLEQLAAIAPLTAVRGNNDAGRWADRLQQVELVTLADVPIAVLHDIADLPHHPRARAARVVVTGHSHKPMVEERDGVLFVNPGSAGPRRFTLPISAGELLVEAGQARAQLRQFAS